MNNEENIWEIAKHGAKGQQVLIECMQALLATNSCWQDDVDAIWLMISLHNMLSVQITVSIAAANHPMLEQIDQRFEKEMDGFVRSTRLMEIAAEIIEANREG